MKAIVYHSYGPPDVLKCEEIEKPTAGDNEVLIKVRAASVNPVDLLFRGTSYMVRIMTGLRKPKETRIGHDVAGQVEAAGRNVTQFKPGDAVFGTCKGAFAEYLDAPVGLCPRVLLISLHAQIQSVIVYEGAPVRVTAQSFKKM